LPKLLQTEAIGLFHDQDDCELLRYGAGVHRQEGQVGCAGALNE
jgi:hypothetical protein